MTTKASKQIADLPVFTGFDDPDWGMDFHSTYDDLFARS